MHDLNVEVWQHLSSLSQLKSFSQFCFSTLPIDSGTGHVPVLKLGAQNAFFCIVHFEFWHFSSCFNWHVVLAAQSFSYILIHVRFLFLNIEKVDFLFTSHGFLAQTQIHPPFWSLDGAVPYGQSWGQSLHLVE